MKLNHFPLLLVALLATPAFAQDAPPVNSQELLRALKLLQSRNEEMQKAQFNKAIQDFRAAASSNSKAIAFYEEAVRATRFAGQTLQQTQFQEWKKKEAERLRSNEMQTAARLHLTYAVLTLEAARGTPIEQLLPALFQYTNEILKLREDPDRRADFDKQELLKGSISGGVFIQWYGAGKMLTSLKGWEGSPGDVDGIYQKTILPEMRKQKDFRITQYWDARIDREARQVEHGKGAFKIDQFNQIQKPNLLWQRAEDMLAVGQQNRAISEMFGLIKNFPDHPETPARIAKLEKLLTPPPAAAPSPASDQTPAQAAAQ